MKIKWRTCALIGISIFLLYLAIYYWPAVSGFLGALIGTAMPLIIGAMLAYPLNILMKFYERCFFPKSQKAFVRKIRHPLCLTGAVLTLFAIIALIIILIVPQLVSCVQLIISQLPGALDLAVDYMNRLGIVPESIVESLSTVDWESRIGQLVNLLTTGIGGVMDTAVKMISSVFSVTISAVLSFIFSLYVLGSKDKIGSQIRRLGRSYLSPEWRVKLRNAQQIADECFHKYIVGQCIEALILGSLCTVGMLILGMPYATMIGALVAFTALIPVVGAFVGAGVGAFMILMVSPIQALVFLIFIIVLQQLEGNLIYPRVVGSSVGLPGIWVLAAVTVGGGVMGVPGMLLAVPITATVYRMIKNNLAAREAQAAAKTEISEGNGEV